MKFVLILLIAVSFNMIAQAQEHEQETPGKPADEMTLVGKDSGKTLHLEDGKSKKKHSAKKNKKKRKSKRS